MLFTTALLKIAHEGGCGIIGKVTIPSICTFAHTELFSNSRHHLGHLGSIYIECLCLKLVTLLTNGKRYQSIAMQSQEIGCRHVIYEFHRLCDQKV